MVFPAPPPSTPEPWPGGAKNVGRDMFDSEGISFYPRTRGFRNTKTLSETILILLGCFILMERRMDKVHVYESLHSFLSHLASMILKILLVLTVAATVGIEITTFAAILGATSLAVGLAFQGSLANFDS